MFAKRVVSLCASLRRSNIITQRICAYHVTNTEKIKENINSFELDNANTDNLLTELNSRNISKIGLILEANKNIIKGPHIITALNNLFKFYKNDSYDKSNKTGTLLNKNHVYNQINSIIDSKLNQLTCSEIIEILRIFGKAKVLPIKTVEKIFNHIYINLNDLSLNDFGPLSLVIRRMKQTELIENLKMALEKKFIAKLSTDFDENNITSLESVVSFASYHLKNYRLLESIIQSLKNYKGKMPLKSTIIILESLCNMKRHPEGWLDVLHEVENSILKDIDELKVYQINFIMYLISEKFKESFNDEVYNSNFVDKLIEKFIKEDAGFDNALSLLKCLGNLKHESKELLNYSFATYFDKTILSGETLSDPTGKFLVLITNAAMTRQKSIFWKEIEEFILNNNEILKYDPETLTILSLHLLSLGTYHKQMLSQIFNSNFDYSQRNYLQWSFCKIYQELKTNKNYDGPLPAKSQIQSLERLHKVTFEKRKRKEKNSEILRHIEDGLGGSDYVISNLSTKYFHLIDHAIVFQKDGYPFPINTEINLNKTNNLNYIEDLKVPPESQIILIMSLPYYWYFRNTNNLIGTYQMCIDSLEAMHYKVVTINEKVWDELPTLKRTSFVMNEIQSKLLL